MKKENGKLQKGINKLRLKWKIFAYLLGFCALLLAILWLFQTVFLNETYKLIRTRELNRIIDIVEAEIENPDLMSILRDIQINNDILVSPTQDFILPQRLVPQTPGSQTPGSQTSDSQTSVPQTPGSQASGSQTTGSQTTAPQTRIFRGGLSFDTITETREFTLRNGRTISLTFHAIIAPVSATVTTLRIQLYFVTGVMVALSVFLAVVIAKRVSKPIEDVSLSAQSLARGDYDTRFSGKGFYEIDALSDTLNTAAVELGRVESLRRELLANVSHDLRTPLSLIYSYAEMMSDFPDEVTPEQTRIILEETRRLTMLVNDVLDISKLESEMETLYVTRFSLTASISGTTGRVEEFLKNEGFKLIFEHDGEVFVEADETKIGRAYYNLLINAVNYSNGSREIKISQTVSNGRVRISVTDYGEGIAEEEKALIWDRYYRSNESHKRAVVGTGLGLSIVKKIIGLHNGNCGVESEQGMGSTFWFEIGASVY